MKSYLPLIALVALAACNQNSQPEVVDTRAPDPNAAALANAAPVELPPAMRAQKTYRCKDNSLVYVTWFVGDKIADIKAEKDGTPVRLTSAEGTSPWTSAAGWTAAGDDNNIRVTQPGKGPQDCHL
jgi:hypothetical protein